MRKTAGWLCMVMAVVGVCASAAAAVPPPANDLKDAAALKAFVDPLIQTQLKDGNVAGAVVAIVKDGKMLFSEGYVHPDLAGSVQINKQQTPFLIGSISKLFVWTAVMQLAGKGKLDLDADINEYLDFQIPQTFERPVTLRNLLTHTAGFEDNKFGYTAAKGTTDLHLLGPMLAAHIPKRVWPSTANFNDGRHASYSNWGTALAGHIVSHVSGQPFDQYLQKHLLEPLGMAHTGFNGLSPLPLAQGYRHDGSAFQPADPEYTRIWPASSVSSTADDMARFMIAILREGEHDSGRVLEKTNAEAMQRRAMNPHPRVNGASLGFFENHLNGRRTVGHGGKTLSFSAEVLLMPDEELGLFVVYNTPGASPRKFVQAFMDQYFSPGQPPADQPPAGFAQRASQYEGSFASNHRSYSKSESVFGLLWAYDVKATERDTLLISTATGGGIGGPGEWTEIERDVFRRNGAQDVIAFARSDKGTADHIVGPSAFNPAQRLNWHEALTAHALLIAEIVLSKPKDLGAELRKIPAVSLFVTALVIVTFFGWMGLAFVGPVGSAAKHPSLRWAVASLGLVNLLILAALTRTVLAYMNEFGALLAEVPWYLSATSWLALASAALTAWIAYCSVREWRDSQQNMLRRIYLGAVVGVAAAFLAWLWNWSLLGFNHT